MRRIRSTLRAALYATALAAAVMPARAEAAAEATPTAPLLEGMGSHHHPISTTLPLAQRYFDQGLALYYGFNHAEAVRSFREAARLDPKCAICHWGAALALGPNINATTMDEEAAREAWRELGKARRLARRASDAERAYVEALAARYVAEPAPQRGELDAAYAAAMGRLAGRFPQDLDAATLYAEALMIPTAWDYWLPDGSPKPATETILATLDRVLREDPDHPGANHLYIHAVEAARPADGLAAAERLATLVPGAGHLVHMPGHIYIRVGRYHDAVVANQRAIAADDAYVTQCHAQGIYPLAYMPHNRHFLWSAATFEGASRVAIDAAREMAARIDPESMRQPGLETLQHYWVTPLYALVRFGRWDEILAESEPAVDLLYPRGVWHYARAMALTRKGRLEEAADELERLSAIADDPRLASVTVWEINGTASLLEIAREHVAGELAAARGELEGAIAHLEDALRHEDALHYDEPPPWHAPIREYLGQLLVDGARAADAERVYREDLERFPENGWSLYGLASALRAQGKSDEARRVESRFLRAWRYADVRLTASRL